MHRVERAEHARRMVGDDAAGLGELAAAAGAPQQRLADGALERLEVLGGRGCPTPQAPAAAAIEPRRSTWTSSFSRSGSNTWAMPLWKLTVA
jgi:hypothetical protein